MGVVQMGVDLEFGFIESIDTILLIEFDHRFNRFNQFFWNSIESFNLQVSKEKGEQLAREYGIKFEETSTKACINVEETSFTLARDVKVRKFPIHFPAHLNILIKILHQRCSYM